MANRLTFIIDGRDQLSRVLDRAGASAARLQRRLADAADRSSTSMANMTRDAGSNSRAMEKLTASLLSLAPAAVPMAAAAGAIAIQTAAAGAAVGAFGAAIIPQISALGDAASAEKKYEDAVKKSGRTSEEATKAQADYYRAVKDLPPASQKAAAALSEMKDSYKEWSDSLAPDTMSPLIKGMGVLSAAFPKLTPVVRSTSKELDRLFTLAAGAIATPGLDGVMNKFATFSSGVLHKAGDALIRFTTALDTGKVGGGFKAFMDYAAQTGPMVAETLSNLGKATFHLLQGASEAGVTMLTLVNALASIVAAVPPGTIGLFLQLYTAFKLASLGAAALTAVTGSGAAASLIRFARAAQFGGIASATSGVVQGMSAMSKATAIAAAAFAAFYIGQQIGQSFWGQTPYKAEEITRAFTKLSQTGRLAGIDMGRMADSLKRLNQDTGVMDTIYDYGTFHSNEEWKKAAGDIDAFDQQLAALVSSGNVTLAKQGYEQLAAAAAKNGTSADEVKAKLPAYQEALATLAAEQQIAARAMGLFGTQAQGVQAKLDAQKQSTDGLRQSINALNNAALVARGGIRGMEAAIDAATKAAKDNGRTLDENTEKGRANNQALDELASSTIKAAESARENGASWASVNRIYDRGRAALVASARQMGLTEAQAKKLAAQILRTPDKTARLKGNMEDLQAKLNSAKAQLGRVPDSRKAAVRAQISDLEAKIRIAKYKLDQMNGRTATTYINTIYSSANRTRIVNGVAVRSRGGIVRGPGTSTSDSIPAMLSDTEYVVRAAAVRRVGVGYLDAINEGRTPPPLPGTSGGMPASAGRAPVAARPGRGAAVVARPTVINITIPGLVVDPDGTARAIDKVLTEHKRDRGGAKFNFEN